MRDDPTVMTVEIDVAVEDEQRLIDALARMTEGTQVDLVAVRTEDTPTGWPQAMLVGPRPEMLEVLVRGGYDDHPSTYEVES